MGELNSAAKKGRGREPVSKIQRLRRNLWLMVTPCVLLALATINFVFLNQTAPTWRLFLMPIVVGLILGGLIQALSRQRDLLRDLNSELEQAHTELLLRQQTTLAANRRLRSVQGAAILAVGAVHDLRNLLFPITLGAEMIGSSNKVDRQTVEDLILASEQGAILCNKILTAIQPNATRSKYSVEALMSEVWRRVRVLLPQPIEPQLSLESGDVYVDSDDFVQIVHNLTLNALQVCGEGLRLEILGRSSMDQYCIGVRDNGPGLPEDILKGVEAPELRLIDGQPRGLGLAIVKELAARNQITLRVDSNPMGSTVWLEFRCEGQVTSQ